MRLIDLKRKFTLYCESSKNGQQLYASIRKTISGVCSILPDSLYAKMFYRFYTGEKLDLKNPTSVNDKMWWLKLYNRDPLLTVCSDKYLARSYVREKGFSDILIPQFDVFDDAREIDFSKYTEQVIFKCNNGSGGYIFFNPEDKEFDKNNAVKFLNKHLREKYYKIAREWNYKNIPPKILAEKVIRDKDGNVPKDYRFFCFDGKPELLMVDFGVLDIGGNYQRIFPRNIYDMDFNRLDLKWGNTSEFEGSVEKPKNLDYMIEIAKALSEPFPLVRVDLYNVDGRVYFGELTFYHAGCSRIIKPDSWEKKIASWIDLNNPKIVRKKN